jgi:hypothetical protein
METMVAENKSNATVRIRVRICMLVARVYRETLISGIWIEREPCPPAIAAKQERIWEHFAGHAKILPRLMFMSTWCYALSVSI